MPDRSILRPVAALVALGGVAGALALSSPGQARPSAPPAFCDVYPEAPSCASGEASCDTCHDAPPGFNAYGQDVSDALPPYTHDDADPAAFHVALGEALLAVEGVDSDGDGFDNLTEIEEGTSPSDASSAPAQKACVDEQEDGWNLCGYDVDYTFKKVMIDFCGRSPTLLEKEQFAAEKNPNQALHQVLDVCLDSEHWRGEGGRVWSLANDKISPIRAVKSGRDAGPIPLADYDDDYAMFVWTQTDDRDARLVLTGQDFVTAKQADGRTVYEVWNRDPDEDVDARGEDAAQQVVEERRAGMITTRWFLTENTMFTGVPRTTAAQAYRSYLGYDISRLEGLSPVEGEPADYDNKGVQEAACARCHSTLDPLTYPFSRYEGIGGGNAPSYSYGANRMRGFIDVDGERVADTPEVGVIFGQEVADLVEWADVAANSEAFRRATVRDYWRLLFGEDPRATEQADFGQLVDDFGSEHGYQVEQMLHALIETEAYGAP